MSLYRSVHLERTHVTAGVRRQNSEDPQKRGALSLLQWGLSQNVETLNPINTALTQVYNEQDLKTNKLYRVVPPGEMSHESDIVWPRCAISIVARVGDAASDRGEILECFTPIFVLIYRGVYGKPTLLGSRLRAPFHATVVRRTKEERPNK